MSKKVRDDLTLQQEDFCKNFVTKDFFGNGVEAYIDAYKIDVNKKGAYDGARASASKLLTKANILKRIDTLLENEGLNDQFVDKQLLLLITQNADYSAKTRAIAEYNKLKQRITDKLELHGELKTKTISETTLFKVKKINNK